MNSLKKIFYLKLSLTLVEHIQLFIQFALLKINVRFFNQPNKVVSIRIGSFKLHAYDYETAQYLLEEVWLNEDYYFNVSQKQPIIFDCGANIGVSVLYFKALYPKSTIIAFEPNPNLFALLEKNVLDNQLKDVYIHQVALSATNEEISFFINDNLGSFLSSKFQHRGGDNEIRVKAEQLSGYIKRYPNIDLLKMDIEGAEYEVIQELNEKNLLDAVQKFIVEYHYFKDRDQGKMEIFIDTFAQSGFAYTTDKPIDKLLSFQDVVFTFTKSVSTF